MTGWNPISRELFRVCDSEPKDIPILHAALDEALLHSIHQRDVMGYALAVHFYRIGLEDRLGISETLKKEFPLP